MMNVADKRHWYDGWIYDRLLAPNQQVAFQKICNLIAEGSSVIDIGCGTGRLDFRLAGRCRSVLAIDLSETNINTALRTRDLLEVNNVQFIHSDLAAVAKEDSKFFDYSVLSYILHEVSTSERIKLLTDAASISEKIIISDHKPEIKIVPKIIREVLEMGAGMDHYSNYRSFINEGGIKQLAAETRLKIIHEEVHSSHLHIVVLQKS
jgi:SAM-dependent methyltransferase